MTMKSPDEIKKGLECCMDHNGTCEDCPYVDGECRAFEQLAEDALALIQQLEKRAIHLEALNQSNLTTITMQERTRARLQERISQLEAERDALVADIRMEGGLCSICKYADNMAHSESCRDCNVLVLSDHSNWEWRGVQKEETDA